MVVLQIVLGRRVHDEANRGAVKKLIAFAGLVAIFFVVSAIFGQRLGQFTTALGVAGAGIATSGWRARRCRA